MEKYLLVQTEYSNRETSLYQQNVCKEIKVT